MQEDRYELKFDAVWPDSAGLDGACTSFNASLENRVEGGVGLAGLSGLLIDMDKVGGCICVTIHDGLKRHTPPKRFTVASEAKAQADLDAGTDARFQASSRYALFLWLPEVFDESEGVGTRLLAAIQTFLKLRDASVMIDFGVGHAEKEADEEHGFVEIFYPELNDFDLELSDCGQFATGTWSRSVSRTRPVRDVGFVYL